MSSQYPVLDNRPIDQWKVVELKEELKRRKLTTKGLKDDLIKRLDEAISNENESTEGNVDNGFDSASQLEDQSEDALPAVAEISREIVNHGDNIKDKIDGGRLQFDVSEVQASMDRDEVPQGEVTGGTDVTGEEKQLAQPISAETGIMVSESVISNITLRGQDFQKNETLNDSEDLRAQLENEDSKSLCEDPKLNSSDPGNQVSEVSPVSGLHVKSDSISADSVSVNEKSELKDHVIADDVKLELDVKPEVVQKSSSTVVHDGGKLVPMDVEEHESKVPVEDTGGHNTENADVGKKIDSEDVGYPEKLNLDRSSGEDSMDDDVLESKQIDSKFNSSEVEETMQVVSKFNCIEVGEKGEKTEVPVVKDDDCADVLVAKLPADNKNMNAESKNDPDALSTKRKLNDHEMAENNEITKRQRRWNSGGLKVPEPQNNNHTPSTTPTDAYQPTMKRNFSRSDSTVSDESPKERIVPPSSKPATSSLRIDRFLRPFTLKAVQELLGKTGTVTSFWMDPIKTHCYVTYSSMEEAVETRNAVYDLKWPPNGGRHLVAEFVDAQEVKIRVEAPQLPTTPRSTGPAHHSAIPSPSTMQPQVPQHSPRLQDLRERLPSPPPLPPPPPLSDPPPARERLPPPAQLIPEKVDPPIVTLDDLFRKTKATPRIYYLPLSDEQVTAKLKAQGGIVLQ